MLRRSSITNKCSQCTGTKFLKENLRHYISIIKSPPFIQKWGMLCYSSSTIVVIGLGFRRSSSVVELLFTPFLWSWTIGRQIRKGIVHRGKEVVIECILVLYSNSTNYIPYIVASLLSLLKAVELLLMLVVVVVLIRGWVYCPSIYYHSSSSIVQLHSQYSSSSK